MRLHTTCTGVLLTGGVTKRAAHRRRDKACCSQEA
jgi:hypothetical protein